MFDEQLLLKQGEVVLYWGSFINLQNEKLLAIFDLVGQSLIWSCNHLSGVASYHCMLNVLKTTNK